MVTCEIGSLLNIDLSATWVRAILEPPGIVSTVLSNLKAEYGIEIAKNTLMSRYGILIADLWDEGLEHRLQNAPVHNTNTAVQDVFGTSEMLHKGTFFGLTPNATILPKVEDTVIRSYKSGNAITWAWLHLRLWRALKVGNSLLWNDIFSMDPDFKQKDMITRLILRTGRSGQGYGKIGLRNVSIAT